MFATEGSKLKTVNTLLKHGADVDAVNEVTTPLAAPVRAQGRHGNTTLPCLQDESTAMHLASLHGHTRIADALVAAGANLNMINLVQDEWRAV